MPTSLPPPFAHVPVLMDAVLEMAAVAVRSQPAGTALQFVDCTVGGAGHAERLLALYPQAQLLALDRDPTAVQVARARLQAFGSRCTVVHATMSDLPALLAARRLPAVHFLLADFGVSSHQLDTAARGFALRPEAADSPLDMRMDPSCGESALQLMERLEAGDLADLIYRFGEERRSRAVARAIKAAKPRTTHALAKVVAACIPARGHSGSHPATRTFQALRMAVNDELGEIAALLLALPDLLQDAGVATLISFHSLEDRAVKLALRAAGRRCICPPQLPVCACTTVPTLTLLTSKARVASADELARNGRARSARLRAAQRCTRSSA